MTDPTTHLRTLRQGLAPTARCRFAERASRG